MFRFLVAALAALFLAAQTAHAGEPRILVQSTTSTQNSGLYNHLLPMFQRETGIRVDVVAVGTGQAIRNAENGDADVLLVHAKDAEEKFVAEGHGLKRHPLMYNDFVIIGPRDDPAGVAQAADLDIALSALSSGPAPFLSRGDDSGTHKKERRLWAALGITPAGGHYRETGSGMGSTIRVAIEMNGYTLTDRATWIAFGNKADHQILFEGSADLFNQYGVIQLNPVRHPHINVAGAEKFIGWLLSDAGQAAIASYTVEGQQLFFPNASGS